MKTNYQVRHAAHPQDVKNYDTERLRENFLIEKLFEADEVNMVYSLYDRLIVGGAMPVKEPLELANIDPLKAPFFLHRRELGIVNVGGAGTVTVDDTTYELDYKEALYLGKGDRKVVFASKNAAQPAHFYFNSAPAHTTYPDKKISEKDRIVIELGAPETCNHRMLNKLIVNEILPTCQLQMGMTQLLNGSVWNTMPPHTHDRRMEAYFYFDLPQDQAVCHFMGQIKETRHIWMHNEQAVISPVWSIHSAAATASYTFIWGMGGENLDYDDKDNSLPTELR